MERTRKKLDGYYSRYLVDIGGTAEERRIRDTSTCSRWYCRSTCRYNDPRGTPRGSAKVEWKSGPASITIPAVSHDRAGRNRAAQCANATHCSRLEKLVLVTEGGRGATMAWTIVHAFAVENYSRGHRVAPHFRLSGRIGSTGERNEGNRGNFWSLYQFLWKIEKYVTLSIRMFSKTDFLDPWFIEQFLGRLYSNCLSRAGIISLNFWIDIILIILIIFDDSSNRVYFLKSF